MNNTLNTNSKYSDLHIHSKYSDGILTPEEIILSAIEQNIGVICITDHNRFLEKTEFDMLQNKYEDKIELLYGAEVSCTYSIDEQSFEIHIIALFPVPFYKWINTFEEKILAKNRNRSNEERKNYITAIIEKLQEYDIDLGTYEELQAMFPEQNLGRSHIAQAMVTKKFVQHCSVAFDEFIGDYGKRKAYVKKGKEYCSFNEVVEAIIESKGIPILAHLKSYRLNPEQEKKLLYDFSQLTSGIGAMETEYRRYNEQIRKELRVLSEEYGLMQSAGSDYHGIFEDDDWDNKFSYSFYEIMEKAWNAFYVYRINFRDFME